MPSDYSKIPKEKLIEVCSRSLSTVDGLWFLAIEQEYGFDAALKLDMEVWRKFGLIHGRRLVKNFALKEDNPIRTLIKLIQADPLLVIYKPEVVMLTDNKAVFRCNECPTQAARIRDGKGVFPGQRVCSTMYRAYADVLDPQVNVRCLTCSPDAKSPQYWCEWQFEI